MKINKIQLKLLRFSGFLFLFILFIALPFFASAAESVPAYKQLVRIPGVNPDANVGDYVKALYILAISIGAFLAVIKLIIAGVKYMASDIVTTKSDAIKDIKGALFGLLIVLGAVLILSTINEDLTGFAVFDAPATESGIRRGYEGSAPNINYTPPVGSTVSYYDCTDGNCGGALEACKNQEGSDFIDARMEVERIMCITKPSDGRVILWEEIVANRIDAILLADDCKTKEGGNVEEELLDEDENGDRKTKVTCYE